MKKPRGSRPENYGVIGALVVFSSLVFGGLLWMQSIGSDTQYVAAEEPVTRPWFDNSLSLSFTSDNPDSPKISATERTTRAHATKGAVVGHPLWASGDIVDVAGERFSLVGIQAATGVTYCGSTEFSLSCGRDAVGALQELTRGEPIACYRLGHSPEGMQIGRCYWAGHDLSVVLARHGLARATEGGLMGYRVNEGLAKRDKLGIWAN